MEDKSLKGRIGCSLLKFPTVYFKQQLPMLGSLVTAWALERKITFVRPGLIECTLPLGLLINQLSSPKAAAFYRLRVEAMQRKSLTDHCWSVLSSVGLTLVLNRPFVVQACKRIPILAEVCSLYTEYSFFVLALEGAIPLFLPIYFCWCAPAEKGDFANYKPLSFEKEERLKMRIWNQVAEEAPTQIVMLAFRIYPAFIFSDFLEALENSYGLSEKNTLSFEKRLDRFSDAKKGLDLSSEIQDAKTFYQHFIKGQTWDKKIFDNVVLLLTGRKVTLWPFAGMA